MSSGEPLAPVYRIVIADDHAAMREALAELIGAHPSFRVVAVAQDAMEAVRYCVAHRPDLVLLDAAMPYGGGPFAAELIAELVPKTLIVCLTAYTDERTRAEMLRSGASAVLHKGTGDDIASRLLEVHTTLLAADAHG